MKRILFFALTIAFSINVYAGPGDWRETLKWLETYYNYPESGPNYDWPSSYLPKVLPDNTIMTIDGTKIPVPAGAYEISFNASQSSFKTPAPQTGIYYRVKCAGQNSCDKTMNEIAQIFKKTYGMDIYKIDWQKNESSVTIKGSNNKIFLEILAPGKMNGKSIVFPEEEDYFAVNYSVTNVEHFFFDRSMLKVNSGKVTLTDGTVVPLVPGKKINQVTTGNVQGSETPLVIVSYMLTIFDKDDANYKKKYTDDFVKIYTFYSNHFKFPVDKYKIWDQDTESYIISYSDASKEVRIKIAGQPENNGLTTNIDRAVERDKASKTDQDGYNVYFGYIYVEVYFKNKKQIIPGTDEPLPKTNNE